MKKLILLALTLVLTTALFTGCGCTSQDAQYTTVPTTLPTIAPTPTTEMTRPSTEATTQPTIDRGNGPMEDTTGTTASTTDPTGTTDASGTTGSTNTTEQTQEGRTRQMQPSANSR